MQMRASTGFYLKNKSFSPQHRRCTPRVSKYPSFAGFRPLAASRIAFSVRQGLTAPSASR